MENNASILNPVIASSTNPTAVANWIKGLILGFSSIITLVVLNLFHVELTASNLDSLATGVGMVAGAIWFVYGLIHKGVATLGRVK